MKKSLLLFAGILWGAYMFSACDKKDAPPKEENEEVPTSYNVITNGNAL